MGFFAGIFNGLIGQTGNGNHQQDLEDDIQPIPGPGTQRRHLRQKRKKDGEKKNTDDQDQQDKGGPATGMQRGVPFGVFHGQFLTGLIGENRFVFRSMILKDPSNIFETGDDPDISDKEKNFDPSVQEMKRERIDSELEGSQIRPDRH